MNDDIYDPAFVADLFDRCSNRYRWWSVVASFGLIWVWRRQCVSRLMGMQRIAKLKGASLPNAPSVTDMMAGTGEVWPHLLRAFPQARITAVDISGEMHREAVARLHGQLARQINHIQADALNTELPDYTDLLISTFGLKTLTKAGQTRLAERIATTLRPGGSFALIETSDPKDWILRPVYRLYLDKVLPFIERLALNGAKDFSMLGVYTKNFGDCTHFAQALRAQGLFVSERAHIFGCATSVAGFKHIAPPCDAP